MSGVRIVGALMAGFAPLTARVPAAQIKAWRLPQGVPLPSIVVTRVSRTKMQFLAARAAWLVTERVQVTVRTGSGSQRETILGLIEQACTDKIGKIADFTDVAVLFAGGGPDFMDDAASIFMASADFRVSFNEPA